MPNSLSGPKTLVVIPTYNERENIARLCRDVLSQADSIEVLVVDDNSPDGTAELVESLAAAEPRIHLLRRPGKLGLGTAHIAGYRWALERDYGLVVTMDADFSHPPERIPDMIRASGEFHVVIGSRYVEGGGYENWPARRVFLSATANWVARTFLRLKARDCTGAFRCFRREVLEAVPLENIRARGYSFQEEMLWQCTRPEWQIGEVPITFVDRAAGASKISLREMIGGVLTIVRLVLTSRGRKLGGQARRTQD